MKQKISEMCVGRIVSGNEKLILLHALFAIHLNKADKTDFLKSYSSTTFIH